MSKTMDALDALPESGNLREYIGGLSVEVAVRVVKAFIIEKTATESLRYADLDAVFDGIQLAHVNHLKAGDVPSRIWALTQELEKDMPVNATCELSDLLPEDLVNHEVAHTTLYRLLLKSVNFYVHRPNREAGKSRTIVVRRIPGTTKRFRAHKHNPGTPYLPPHRRLSLQAS